VLDYLYPLIDAIEHHVNENSAPGVHYSSKRVADELSRLRTEEFTPEVRTDYVFARTELTRWGTRIVGVPWRENWPHVKKALHRACEGHVGEKASAEEQVGRRVLSLFREPVRKVLPETTTLLHSAEVQLGQTEDTGWNNVANSCRDALVCFSTELHALAPDSIPAEIKRGDLKNTVRAVLRTNEGNDRYATGVAELIDSLWNHVGNLVHRPRASRDDAERCFISTIIAISEVIYLLRE